MKEVSKHIGWDVHKDPIAVSIADAGRTRARFYGAIENTPQALSSRLKKINQDGEVLGLRYEAGPYGLGYASRLPCSSPCPLPCF